MTIDTKWLQLVGVLLSSAIVYSTGCEKEHSAGTEPSTSRTGSASETSHKHESKPKSGSSSNTEAASASSDPRDRLEELDQRRSVPLLPRMAHHQKQNMRQHLVAVRNIAEAASHRDFDGIREAAEPIGSSPEMQQMCRHMGAGAKGFTKRALEFHERADGIVESAEREDLEGVFQSLSRTLQTCTSCHSTYKQKVVSPGTWEKETGMSPPDGPHGGGRGPHD